MLMVFTIFRNKKRESSKFEEYDKAISMLNEIAYLLAEDEYLARSNYQPYIDKYRPAYEFFHNMKKANILTVYCKKNKLNKDPLEKFLSYYDDIKDLKTEATIIANHNEAYIKRHLEEDKAYLDNILASIDKNITLDDEQRIAVLTDEDYSLIIAGAGAGKTTTVAAKVKYLVDKKQINPREILVISFTNKAVNELKERINQGLKIDCPITTFHKSGYAILQKEDNTKKMVATESMLFNIVNDYLKKNILAKPEMVDKVITFFGHYFDMPYEGDDINAFFNIISKKDYSSLKSNIGDYNKVIIDRRRKIHQTINNEILRSAQEVQIANFLYLNGIEYEYEAIYPYHILKARKPYTPDFKLTQDDKVFYLEHFGLSESGTNSFYSQSELEKYKQEINDKIILHRQHNTKLIYTFSSYNDGRDFLTHLAEILLKNNFVFKERSKKELFTKLINTEENKYIVRLVRLICIFISNFKTNAYGLEDFYRMENANPNVRSKLFLEIARECYLEYQRQLSSNHALDFQDMINEAADMLRAKESIGEKLGFKYVIVDEYQDISRQRFDLTKALSKICQAKIVAVGDDWQSIYAFSGSDISLFTKFSDTFTYAKELKIIKTYRNAQEVIDIAGNFIQKNTAQIRKSLISPKHIDKPIIINTYSEKTDKKMLIQRGGKYYNIGKALEKIIGEIISNNKNSLSTILLIGRYGFDGQNICFSNDFIYNEKNGIIFSKKYPHQKLAFLTAHSSKGLGYDDVVIINAKNEIYGFPAKIEDDPVLRYVTKYDDSFDYAEERRLFYVALTRTKNRVYILSPEDHPSEFVLELLNDYPNISLEGKLNKESKTNYGYIKKCPLCGYPLQLRWKNNYGMKLWLCTNEPEICNFISNDLGGKDLTIQKCDECCDGYLIIKRSNMEEYFLGCSNYNSDNTGCNKTLSKEQYNKWRHDAYEEDKSREKPSFHKIEIRDYIPLSRQSTEKEADNIKTKKASFIHVTTTFKETIAKEGFDVIVDNEGKILTDMGLLKHLKAIRYKISNQTQKKAYLIFKNKDLVTLATFKPINQKEFLDLEGFGIVKYNNYGALFIAEIKKYYER